jgi:magnesium-transporting ATPase (P-type)
MIKTHIKWTQAIAVLIAANLVPAVGVVSYDWDLFSLIFVYWLENGVIGVFTVLKMLTTYSELSQGEVKSARVRRSWYREAGRYRFNWFVLILVAFFLIHYGLFWMGHWEGLVMLFGDNLRSHMQHYREHTGLLYTLLGLVLSHGVSFRRNYIQQGERMRMDVPILMFVPYRRVWGLHLIIMLVAGVVDLAGGSRTGLLMLIVVKIVADIFAHSYERASCAEEEVEEGASGSQGIHRKGKHKANTTLQVTSQKRRT